MKIIYENFGTEKNMERIWKETVDNYKVPFREWMIILKSYGRFENDISDIKWIENMSKVKKN